MRVLTVRQPWAWAIIHGGKNVENRTRNIAGDYRGPVAIHAGLSSDGFDALLTVDRLIRETRPEFHREHVGKIGRAALERGSIIGVVDLVDVHWAPLGDSAAGEPWGEDECWHLVFANPRAIKTPISFRGGLGLRWLDPEVRAMVADQLRHGAQR